MKLFSIALISAAVVCTASFSPSAQANGDHGAAAVKTAKASPRFSASSDLFEVVGIVEGNQLGVYVDRYATNEPVTAAKIEMQIGADQFVGVLRAEHGDFVFANAKFDKPGSYPIVLTINAGEDIDILAGNLLVAANDDEHAHGWFSEGKWLIAAVVLVGLLLLGIWFRLRMGRQRQHAMNTGASHV